MSLKFLLISLILFCGSITVSQSKALDPKKVTIALNCGSKSQEVSSGQGSLKYLPDVKYVKKQSVDVDYHNDNNAVDADIKYTFEKDLYMYERHTYEEMVYELPIKSGKNTIILKFAEMYFKNKGERVFNIKIGNTVVRENFDVIENSGSKYAAHEEYIEVNVKGIDVYYNGAKVSGGIQNKKLVLSFVKGKSDNPIVQGIIVYHDSLQNSPKSDFDALKNKWNTQQEMQAAKKQEKLLKQLALIQNKKERVVIRNDQLHSDQDQVNKAVNGSAQPGDKYGVVRGLLMGPIGIIGWSLLFGYLGWFVFSKVLKVQNGCIVGQKEGHDQ